jgi:hypothetical protein
MARAVREDGDLLAEPPQQQTPPRLPPTLGDVLELPTDCRKRIFEYLSYTDVIPQSCRIRVLGFLGPEDLGSAAIVSKQFRDDCSNEWLTQERTVVVRIPPDCPHQDRLERLGTCLLRMNSAKTPAGFRRLGHFKRLRIVDPHRGVRNVRGWHSPRVGYDSVIPGIRRLEWSREEPASSLGGLSHDYQEGNLAWRTELKGLFSVLTGVRVVDFTHARFVGRKVLSDSWVWEPGRIGAVIWHHHWCCLRLDGYGFQRYNGSELTAVLMDGACFTDPRRRQKLFECMVGSLGRVSIKGARWVRHKGAEPAPIPQRP